MSTAEPQDRTAALLARIRTGTWLDAQRFPPLAWIVPGVIAEGFGLVVGPPKLGKSWFVLGLGLAAACGGRGLGRIPMDQRPVLYAALEDGDRRMQDRARKLMAGEPLPAEFHYFTKATPVEILPIVEAWLNANPTGLVMLDTLGKVMPPALPGESAYARDYRIGGRLKQLSDSHPGSALLVVHHNRKGISSDWMDATSGTQGLNGAADWTILLERSRGDGNALLRVSGRDVIEGEYAVTMTDGSWQLSGRNLADAADAARTAAVTKGVGDDMARIVELVMRNPQGMTTAQVVSELEIGSESVSRYLSRAVENGRIARLRRGVYIPVSEVSEVSEVDGTVIAFPTRSDTSDTHTQDGPLWEN